MSTCALSRRAAAILCLAACAAPALGARAGLRPSALRPSPASPPGGGAVPARPAAPRARVLLAAAKAKKGAKPGAGGGFGAKPATPTGPTAKELLAQATKTYEQLESITSVGDEQTTVTEWSVTVRAEGVAELCDWVPVALIALHCPGVSDVAALVPGALASARREILEAGGQAVPKLRTAPRDRIEFAFEPLHSFHKNVHEGLSKRGGTRDEARRTLGVEPSASAADVKKAHRKLVMELHPDRFVGNEAGAAAALERMLAVSEAYEELGGGARGGGGSASWYERIGGKSRTSFAAAGRLGKEDAQPWIDAASVAGYRLGVCPLEAELALDFVARNVMRAASASVDAAAEEAAAAS